MLYREVIWFITIILVSTHSLINPRLLWQRHFKQAVGLSISNSVRRSSIIATKLNEFRKLGLVDSSLNTQENALISLFESVRPSVVYISTFLTAFNPLQMNVMEVPSQTGSGFVWDSDGHIVTNYHVLGADVTEVQVNML